jgi:hypothetical protein
VRAIIFVAGVLAAAAAGAQEGSGTAAGPSTVARSGPLTVSYRSQTAVYVSAGRAAGLAVGDRLAALSGDEKTAELEVVFLAEHSSSCRVISETQPLEPGDKLVRLGAPRPAKPADGGREFTVTEPAQPAPAQYGAAPAPRRNTPRATRITGGASVAAGGFQDSSGSGRDIQEQGARADVSARDIGGMPLEARLRTSVRRVERDGLRGLSVKAVDSRQRLFEASVTWAPAGGSFSAAAGRLGGGPFPSLGYLDGVVAQGRPTSGVHIGGFFGRTPDALDVGLPTGAKYGAFVRFAREGGGSPGELVFSGAREMAGSEVSREYIGQQGQFRSGNVWFYERMEIDLNRGWRLERAGNAVDLSEARALLTWRASHEADFTVSYDRSRNYWSALNRGLPTEVFDRRLRQSLRADLQMSRPGGLGYWMGGSLRAEEGTEEPSYAAHAGARSPRFASVNLSVEGSWFSSPSTRGAILTARGGRSLRGGHRVDASYTVNRYQSGGAGWNMSQWLRVSGYAQGFGQAFGRADVEYAIQDPLPGLRGFIEIGYRF